MTIDAPIRAVILDMDGLMLDTEGMSRIAWRRTLAEWGFVLSDRQYLDLLGLTLADVGKRMRIWYGADIPYDSMCRRKLSLVDEIIASEGIPQKPGLLPFLAAADSLGLRKAVATSTGRRRAIDKLKLSGVPDGFGTVAGGDEVAHGKPAPDIFLLAARRLGISPEECLALEDSDPGVWAAHAAGMRVVIIPDQKPPSQETAALAWQILPDLCQAAEFLTHQMHAIAPDGKNGMR